jgi:hypothetical protein
MPAEATEGTHAQAATAGGRSASAADRERAAEEWARIVRALTATDEDEVPLFGRLPA